MCGSAGLSVGMCGCVWLCVGVQLWEALCSCALLCGWLRSALRRVWGVGVLVLVAGFAYLTPSLSWHSVLKASIGSRRACDQGRRARMQEVLCPREGQAGGWPAGWMRLTGWDAIAKVAAASWGSDGGTRSGGCLTHCQIISLADKMIPQ